MSDVIGAEQLRLLIERIERLEEEKRAIVRLRRMEKHHRDETDALLETYKAALGLS